MNVHIVYRADRIRYMGEPIGNDWSFYFHTSAGISHFESSLEPGNVDQTPKVIGVFEAEENEELMDTWWVSVVEKDTMQDDRAVSSRHVAPIIVERGVEVIRTIPVEISRYRSFGA